MLQQLLQVVTSDALNQRKYKKPTYNLRAFECDCIIKDTVGIIGEVPGFVLKISTFGKWLGTISTRFRATHQSENKYCTK